MNSEAIAQHLLDLIKLKDADDHEVAHSQADDLLLAIIDALASPPIADEIRLAYDNITKWYS